MAFTQEQKDGFFEAIESMKKYRRADLMDEKGRSILEKLYTDLLPNDLILKKALSNNTTFLLEGKELESQPYSYDLNKNFEKKEIIFPATSMLKPYLRNRNLNICLLKKLKKLFPKNYCKNI